MKQSGWLFNRFLEKQKGAISLLGAASIVLSLFGFTEVLEYGNAKILDRQLDNYARTVASVALRSELAITQDMDRGLTDTTVTQLLNAGGMALPNPGNPDAAFDLEKKITFGNIVDGKFVPLNSFADNPKASDDYIEFSAVAVELWSTSKGYSVIPGQAPIFIPSGKAIYGLPEADINSPDIANCFCDKRYEMCLVSDMAGVTASFPGTVGTVGSVARQNYCEYGYVDSHPGNVNKTKYPSVVLSPQWLGKDKADDGTVLIDFSNATQKASYETVVNQEPLEVVSGTDPFSGQQQWNFWMLSWLFGTSGYYAKDWLGNDLKENNSYVSSYKAFYELDSDGWSWTADKVFVDGYFYVGRKGTCVTGTADSDVPNISGGLTDINNVAQSTSDPEVVRCLSYQKTVGTTTTEVACNMFNMLDMMNPDCWDGTKTVTSDVTGYAQQSCIDFNSNEKTRLNFFQWMMSIFFGPFTSIDTSYEQLDCSVQKMRYFSIKLPFLGGGFTWQIS
ncbi:hypothetical protein [Thiomicrorhabdus sp.]|uniref:hypothetical protein n=1 Tax=Thiomicrorhabdus sp. TaxID=2039724 RepID=UPI00356879A1